MKLGCGTHPKELAQRALDQQPNLLHCSASACYQSLGRQSNQHKIFGSRSGGDSIGPLLGPRSLEIKRYSKMRRRHQASERKTTQHIKRQKGKEEPAKANFNDNSKCMGQRKFKECTGSYQGQFTRKISFSLHTAKRRLLKSGQSRDGMSEGSNI